MRITSKFLFERMRTTAGVKAVVHDYAVDRNQF